VGADRDRYGRYVSTEDYRRSRARKARVVAHLCREYLEDSARTADLGSGTGLIKKELETITGKTLYGFEIDRTFMEETERTVQADVLALPVRSGSLDFVFLNHLYEHVSNQGALFAEAYRVLTSGGRAYVTAGNRFAVMEPHYRLPFLSWLPRQAADAYLRASRRGSQYEGIRFLTYRPLRQLMRGAGFLVRDITERTIDELIDSTWGRPWGTGWRAFRTLPAAARRSLLQSASPQWFFILEKPVLPPGPEEVSEVGS
jgi:SAM-dependent methyltransferase